jgi:hypothetical protein
MRGFGLCSSSPIEPLQFLSGLGLLLSVGESIHTRMRGITRRPVESGQEPFPFTINGKIKMQI